ncbi:MAG TPA: flippase-like domain-containing protein [Candidatus Acidoferrum sp.]|nr:flippase-like domain-containing protein [Candidatus Acidoferrum sp.]
MVRLFLLVLGLVTLVGLVWHIGPARIIEAAAGVGSTAVVLILLPSVLMYVLEAFGWRLTLGRHGLGVGFLRLLAIRTAGEVVNMTTPIAYVGGEPLKAYLLKRQGVPLVEGMASVVTAKTTMTIAQVLFILLGIALGLWVLGTPGNSQISVLAVSVSVMVLLFGTVVFVAVQRHGLFTALLGTLRLCGIRIGFLEAREEKLRALDRAILDFYARDRRGFLLSTAVYFLGWLAEALEVYVILSCLSLPVSVASAVSIGALSAFIKGGTFFIPGSVGAQEGGNLVLLLAVGYTDLSGITFALLRRLRELVWIAVGLVCLAVLGGRIGSAPDQPL